MKTAVELSCRIERPPETVVRVILDPAKAPLWNSGLERFEVIAGKPGEVGAVGLLHYLESGRRYVLEDTLLIGDPGKRYVSRVRGNGLSATVDTSFTALDCV
ncbi:SRPBCC family protein [uncultured Meiothermus sp.]|uniref:SRPBCC family protein n=1 Tax=uncultured Meiothermus sp. TaxID=157471 RepID=UPI002603D82A|nr:SRPBCC family protein [uncultured Meiothermus sp.]